MELQNRARFYAKVTSLLFSQKELRGRLALVARGARYITLGIRLNNPLTLDAALGLSENLALATNTPAVIAQRRADMPGLVSYQFQLAEGYWKSYTRSDVTGLGVGLGEQKRQIDFSFEPPHCLIAGQTRIAGKTETVRSILTGLFTTYAPGDLQAVICDPHRDYETFHNVAHLAYPLAHSIDDIDAAIVYAGQELVRRKERNARDAQPFVLTIDEAETELENPARRAIVQNIGKEAAKFGMHLIIATQKPKTDNMGDLLNNLGNRFIGKVSDAGTSSRLAGRKMVGCELLTGKGDFLHINGDVERLQVALATTQDIDVLPRAEIATPIIEEEDQPRVLNLSEPKAVGRPVNELDPIAVAWYAFHGPEKITRATAEKVFGLKRYNHIAHRDFAQVMVDELRRLVAAKGVVA